jgi:predicted nucleic acid-binding protein
MTAECVLDTNVLVYAAAGRGAADTKRRRAIALIEETDFGLSAQILQEFYVTVTRKLPYSLAPSEALEWIEALDPFPCLAVDRSLVKIAVELAERHRLSYWDAAVVAATQALGAVTLYTEDLNDGQTFDEVRVVNPFLR